MATLFKRGTLGLIVEMVLYLKTYPKGYEVFGMDKEGRKVVIVRRKDLELCVVDAAKGAQVLANFREKTVRLDILSERVEEFNPENG